MYRTQIVVFGLLVLLNPASCTALPLSDPIICYILDGVLIFYCIILTALFFREKVSHQVATAMIPLEPSGGIYQVLDRPKDADPYEVLEPKKKREKRRKRSEAAAKSDREAGAEPVPGTSSSAHLP